MLLLYWRRKMPSSQVSNSYRNLGRLILQLIHQSRAAGTSTLRGLMGISCYTINILSDLLHPTFQRQVNRSGFFCWPSFFYYFFQDKRNIYQKKRLNANFVFTDRMIELCLIIMVYCWDTAVRVFQMNFITCLFEFLTRSWWSLYLVYIIFAGYIS